MGKGIPKGRDTKISRPYAGFVIDKTQLNFKNHWFWGFKSFMSGKVNYIFKHTWLTFLASTKGLTALAAQPVSIARA